MPVGVKIKLVRPLGVGSAHVLAPRAKIAEHVHFCLAAPILLLTEHVQYARGGKTGTAMAVPRPTALQNYDK